VHAHSVKLLLHRALTELQYASACESSVGGLLYFEINASLHVRASGTLHAPLTTVPESATATKSTYMQTFAIILFEMK
jgi:hypothetical protein